MTIRYSEQSLARSPVLIIAGPEARSEFFAGLLILGCVNGLGSRMILSVKDLGWQDALFNAFGISTIVWLSCIVGISIVLRDRAGAVRPADLVVGAGALFLIVLPTASLSWLAVTVICLHVLASASEPLLRRGAVILLATTVPMLWSRMLFAFFANPILEVDASLVGWLLGTPRTGNMVEFADSSGFLVILPACSSLANVSLAFLCWVTLSQLVYHKRRAYDVFWCLLACASVIAVNVIRVSMMGLNELQYHEIHSHWGDAIANTSIFGLTIGFTMLGVRRDLFSRTY